MRAGLVFLVLSLGIAFAEEYQVSKSDRNEVKFISDAPIEDFEGKTDQIDGYLYFEDDDLTKNSYLYFEVDLKSLDTGIGLRNRHMRDNYLHTDKYPITSYKGKIIKAEKSKDDEFTVTTEGTLFIHGLEKPLKVVGTMLKTDDRFQIQCQFEVKLSDFNIEVPSIMFYKIDENMALHLNFYVKRIEVEK